MWISYLQSKDTDTTGSLDQHSLAWLQWLEAIQRIPAGKARAGEGGSLKVVEVLGGMKQAVLVEDTVLAQGAIQDTTKTSFGGSDVNVAILVALAEERHDLVALLELGDLGADFNDFTGTVRAGRNRQIERERVHALRWRRDVLPYRKAITGVAEAHLRDDEITVVEGGALELDQNVKLADLGDGRLTEGQAIEALLGARNSPLLHRGGCHCGESLSRGLSCVQQQTKLLFTAGGKCQRRGGGLYILH